MSRVKRGVIANKTRKRWLKLAKGYRYGRSTKERQAKEAVYHAHNHAFAHRRRKKGNFRALWNVRINAGVRPLGLSYSVLMKKLSDKNVKLNRKMLSRIASENEGVFKKVVDFVK